MSFQTARRIAEDQTRTSRQPAATFRAAIFFGQGEREARYEFEAPTDILSAPPSQLVESLFATVASERASAGDRLEINFAIAHQGCDCITASGRVSRSSGRPIAFILMITQEVTHER